MSPQLVFIIIIAIFAVDFLLESYLDFLNMKCLSEKPPPELEDIYDSGKYAQSQRYERANIRFGLITGTFNLIIILLMFFLDGFATINNMATAISEHHIVQPLIFFAILGLSLDLLNMPFSIYDTFVIEQRFGFNTTTPKIYIADKLKEWLLTGIIGGGIMAAIIWIYLQTTIYFWLWAWALISAFSLLMATFYSSLVVPLFNKQKPLGDGELKDAITRHAVEAGFHIDRIYTIDGSKRSTKANAYFSGIGLKKRIVLFDTLIKDLDTEEIVAVLMHEIGHYRQKHIISSMLLSMLQTGVMLFILSLFVAHPALSQALGVAEPSFHIGLIAFGILFSPISVAVGLMMNIVSRKHECEADAFAARYGMGKGLIKALKKLSVNNLSNLTPHPLYVFFHYSHPTLLTRIGKLTLKALQTA
ncbi:MAG: M48 family metallopeptidase [Bacteroidales bacterium]|jgi:STE24 endopeptidase|nr:M48 family metallopeptidase [Bacteroidales bacterium]